MPNDSSLAVVQAAFGDFQAGNIPALLARLDDDVTWTTPYPRDTVPWGGTWTGKAGVATFFERLGSAYEFTKFDPYEFITAGDRVVALVRLSGAPRATGASVSDESAMVFRIRNGKLSEFREYGDSLPLVAAFAGERAGSHA